MLRPRSECMSMLTRRVLFVIFVCTAAAGRLDAATPVQYRFSFPEPQPRWMQVEAAFAELGEAPLELGMSRSSPGRYALHEFAKNVYDVHVYGRDGRELPATHPDPNGWT